MGGTLDGKGRQPRRGKRRAHFYEERPSRAAPEDGFGIGRLQALFVLVLGAAHDSHGAKVKGRSDVSVMGRGGGDHAESLAPLVPRSHV
jgi:hypothetical protein